MKTSAWAGSVPTTGFDVLESEGDLIVRGGRDVDEALGSMPVELPAIVFDESLLANFLPSNPAGGMLSASGAL